jgi:uncharacterized Ntn-hydrolase superfamily protein
MTFSLLAIDFPTQALGICSITSSPAHGARCLHFKKGVGIIATQGKTNRHHGVRGLDLLSSGCTPEDCLKATRGDDQNVEYRQIAIIDAKGRKAAFTGNCCEDEKGHLLAKDCIAAGNILKYKDVLRAMIDGFHIAQGELANRLLAGINAGELAGGEKHGSFSGFVVVVRPDEMQPWGADVDIRVDFADGVVPAMQKALDRYRAWEAKRLEDQRSTLDGSRPIDARSPKGTEPGL